MDKLKIHKENSFSTIKRKVVKKTIKPLKFFFMLGFYIIGVILINNMPNLQDFYKLAGLIGLFYFLNEINNAKRRIL